ncbi:hypothetical protein [Sphingomonas sp.]|nr:hypothetical protein [Sphingomonas sp.]MBA3512628.1 hypothetical protein [Sphingomonas sp.]
MIHDLAFVHPDAEIGEGTTIWQSVVVLANTSQTKKKGAFASALSCF